MRKFVFSDAKSHKFWNIELTGNSFTVTYGRQGTAGTSQTKTFADDATARKEHDKLVAEKVKKGYTEEVAAKPAGSLREALEAALIADPEDIASHMAYADWLHEQGDPRGAFIQVQLALEDPKKSVKERKALEKQEAALLKTHQEEWLGDLALPMLHVEEESRAKIGFVRGWVKRLEIDGFTVAQTRAIARSERLGMLQELILTTSGYDEDFEPGDDIPEDADEDSAHLYPLARANNLGNVRVFVLGELNPDDDYASCHTSGDGAIVAVKKMPRLEELRLLAHGVDTDELFGLKTLNHLRILHVDHVHTYPFRKLAANPSLTNLTTLLCHPHATEDGEAYIRLDGIRAIARSKYLTSLTHLRLRLSDAGDEGIKELISSGLLQRLKTLDLMHGCVSDAGAELLAACPEVKNLEVLNLRGNRLTAAGIAVLRAVVPHLIADSQWTPNGDEYNDQEYLSRGDYE